ncbi:MAG: hypothetical protein NTZ74_06695 [Chloroflexi bacterium]|nr:hypothetical protein [Chloroflexota bacterium]
MTIKESFWINYKITNDDLDLIYNHLLETQIPASKKELSRFLIDEINNQQTEILHQERVYGAVIYLPKNIYNIGQILVFPHLDWQKGKIISVRSGNNPQYKEFEVITVSFSSLDTKSFASKLEDHALNTPINSLNEDKLQNQELFERYSALISTKLDSILSENDELVFIAGSYFPRSLLVDVSIGHLNLCEAVLEMENGGPLKTHDLISQVELPTDVNANLTEFSLNLALQEDQRFDEVGPAGETLWFLNRLEPQEVRTTPINLIFSGQRKILPPELEKYASFGSEICDELDNDCECEQVDEVTLSLTYPHWRSGTLPLTPKLSQLFPTAYETPRIKFDFLDGKTLNQFPGWVVRPSKYIFGLREWYIKEGFIPGSLLRISRSKLPGQVMICADKQRKNKEWIRTVLVGADGGLVFALLKQVVTCTFDERMVLFIPAVAAIDQIWDSRSRQPVEKTIQNIMHELAKLNPQGHIHAQEIYAAVNLIRRCPPSIIIDVLFNQPWSSHLGDLYFRIHES